MSDDAPAPVPPATDRTSHADVAPTAEEFRQRYDDGQTPWDIGRPQPVFLRHESEVQGSVLDVGCGTGELALHFAARDHLVTGVDSAAAAIAIAEQTRDRLGVPAEFLVADATDLAGLHNRFDTVLDCLVFHCFNDEERVRYVSGLRQVLRPGGRLLMLVFSDQEPPGNGPRRISAYDLAKSFAAGFRVRSLEPERIVVREHDQQLFTPDGPYGWFAIIDRLDDGVLPAT